MPSGSCFCGNIKVEYTGDPAMTVAKVLACPLKHADHYRPSATVLIAERSAGATTATTLLSQVISSRSSQANQKKLPKPPTAASLLLAASVVTAAQRSTDMVIALEVSTA